MSGHSKWHSIKHKKAATDSKRGRIFTRLIKEMTVAARVGGGDLDSNPRLRGVVDTAKAANMPADNIKRAIMKGTGELPGQAYEEVTYEGYGPGGAAIIVAAVTDNKNRTVADLRHVLSKHGGNLGENGCVSWMFDKKGFIAVDKAKADEEQLLEIALDAGAEDLKTEEDSFEIYTSPERFEAVKQAIAGHHIEIAVSEVTMIPQSHVPLDGKKAEQMLKLMEALEDHEDVQNVYANFDIDASQMEAVS